MTHGLMLTFLSLLLYGIWGFGYKLLAVKNIQGEWVVALVMFIGAAISAMMAMYRADAFPLEKITQNIPWLVLVAMSGAVGNIFLIKAMSYPGLSSGVVLAISGAYPLIAAVLAYLFLGEQISLNQIIGMIAVIAGVGLLVSK